MEECKKENSFNQNVDCLLVGAIPEKVGYYSAVFNHIVFNFVCPLFLLDVKWVHGITEVKHHGSHH